MHRTALVNASRIVLSMLLIAALVLLGLAVAIQLLGEPPDVQGWLRTAFGKVFSVVAVGLAAVLGIPAVIGVWAMAGSTRQSATPALPRTLRWILVGVAYVTVIGTAVVLLVTGSVNTVLNLALLALVGLASLGLAGAVNFSPHTWRAGLSGVAVVLVALGTAWLLSNAFIGVGA
jgi:hypothetical protein